ncbi:MAG: NlpC/P60 family protein [Syntrophomonadaceae bacterium]
MKKVIALAICTCLSINFNISPLNAEEINYKVKAGDCLWKIASEHGLSVDYLKKINNLQSDFLQVGDLLTLTSNTLDTSSSSEPNETAYYIVKTGDNLNKIAESQGTTVENLMRVNNLTSDLIYPQQKLIININNQNSPSRAGKIVNSEMLVNKAAEYLGTPYRYGGQAPGGFDCSGFTSYIFKHFGFNLPHNAASQANLGIAVGKNELTSGDLVFFKINSTIDHVGIYCSDGKFIHSSSPRSGGVIYSSLSEPYYSRTYVTARRIMR